MAITILILKIVGIYFLIGALLACVLFLFKMQSLALKNALRQEKLTESDLNAYEKFLNENSFDDAEAQDFGGIATLWLVFLGLILIAGFVYGLERLYMRVEKAIYAFFAKRVEKRVDEVQAEKYRRTHEEVL